MQGLITAMETAVGQVQTDLMSALGGVLPTALTIMGTILVIGLAVKAFKRTSK